MPKCPVCDFEAPAGSVWVEVEHMQREHPEVIERRLREAGIEPFPPGLGFAEPRGRNRVIGMAVTRDDGDVVVTLTTDLQPYVFEVAGADASALGHALKLLSPYGDSDALRMVQERDTLARALQILGLEPETPR